VSIVAIGTSAVTTNIYALAGLVGVIALRPSLEAVSRGANGKDLIIVLGSVGRAQLVLGLTYAVGLAVALH
jgi:hypothetical protein